MSFLILNDVEKSIALMNRKVLLESFVAPDERKNIESLIGSEEIV